jgi:hypothetical protein
MQVSLLSLKLCIVNQLLKRQAAMDKMSDFVQKTSNLSSISKIIRNLSSNFSHEYVDQFHQALVDEREKDATTLERDVSAELIDYFLKKLLQQKQIVLIPFFFY